ncbi:hypothetical protein NP493_1012g00002 [Ridgeia piscesae]|uniref:Uncharacterized protein n=1 Tax=Ridgeia piscesae TaxID=27915 RepID=A0AAD9NJ47_RIDPI|nr:hypothetical protein NP493_1012g00002 [Ridgeia piscesae]
MCSVNTRRTLGPVHIPDDVSVWDVLQTKLQAHGERNRIALIDGPTGRRYSYRELLASIRNVGSALLRRGFRKGDILCIVSGNCCQFPVALQGAISIGGTVTTCNPQSTMDDIRIQLEDCGARWIVTSADNIGKVSNAIRGINGIKEMFCFDDSGDCTPFSELTSDVSRTTKSHGNGAVDPKTDIALLLYSSGTTGKPKGILRTHYAIVSDIYQLSHPSVAYSRSPGSEVYLAILPFFHAYGCMLFQLCCLLNGDTVVVYPRYNAASFVKSIQTYKHHLVLAAVFGMTETGTILMPEWDDDSSNGSVGIPASNTECKIVDPQTGMELGPYQDGELLVRGPSVMIGYLNRSSAADIDSDHWLHTGDMAHYDDCGRFYIVDRYKQLLKYNGYQVVPSYLENVLLTHPAVADAGVIGLPDLRAGELPAAFVVPKAGVTASEAEIRTFVDSGCQMFDMASDLYVVIKKVAPYNRLRGGVTFIEKVPRSPSGKILRRQLRDEALKKRNTISKL